MSNGKFEKPPLPDELLPPEETTKENIKSQEEVPKKEITKEEKNTQVSESEKTAALFGKIKELEKEKPPSAISQLKEWERRYLEFVPPDLVSIMEQLPDDNTKKYIFSLLLKMGIEMELKQDYPGEAKKESERLWIQQILSYAGLLDTRFKKLTHRELYLPNKNFARLKILSQLEEAIEKSENIEKLKEFLKGYCRISLDMDGLKAINDLNDGLHEKGDLALEKVFEIFNDKNFLNALKKETGIEDIMITNEGGDEFSVYIKAGFDVSKKTHIEQKNEGGEMIKEVHCPVNEWILERIKEKVSSLEVSDFLDFNDPVVRKHFKEGEIPEGFKFKMMISGGAISYDEAFEEAAKKENFEGIPYQYALQKIMGKIFDLGDKAMQEDKGATKERLKKGDRDEKFLYKVFSRTTEQMGLIKENEKLQKENEKLKVELEKLIKIIKEEIKEAKIRIDEIGKTVSVLQETRNILPTGEAKDLMREEIEKQKEEAKRLKIRIEELKRDIESSKK